MNLIGTWLSRWLLLAAAALLCGCPTVDWKELNFTRKKPLEANVVGEWFPTAKSRKYILRDGKYPDRDYRIVINTDGTFRMQNMPDWWMDGFGESHGGFHDGTGTWKLDEGKNIWRIWTVMLRFESFSGNEKDPVTKSVLPIKAPFVTWVHLYGQKPPYLLFLGVGDPNDGYAMFFERQQR